jgi:hypothetical protein
MEKEPSTKNDRQDGMPTRGVGFARPGCGGAVVERDWPPSGGTIFWTGAGPKRTEKTYWVTCAWVREIRLMPR